MASQAERDLDALLRGSNPGAEVVPHQSFTLWQLARRGEKTPRYTPDFLLIWRSPDGLITRVEAHELKSSRIEADSRDATIRMSCFHTMYPSVALVLWRTAGKGKFTREV